MIWINQLRLSAAQSRIAQPHRQRTSTPAALSVYDLDQVPFDSQRRIPRRST
jgi:hypothetical protein